jgi:hypothetical protein
MLSHGWMLRVALCAGLSIVLAALGRAQTFGPWLVAGPFEQGSGGDAPAPSHPPERELGQHARGKPGPDLKAKFKVKGKAQGGWTPLLEQPEREVPLDLGQIDLRRRVVPPSGVQGWYRDAALYLYRRIDVDQPCELPLSFGVEGSLCVWIDGTPVAAKPLSGSFNAADVLTRVRLDAGAHHLLVRATSSSHAEWHFRMKTFEEPNVAEARQVVGRVVHRLITRQLRDGTWAGSPSESVYLAWALTHAGLELDHPALELLLKTVDERELANSTAARAWLTLLRLAVAPGREHVAASNLSELAQMQGSRGTWGRWSAGAGVSVEPDTESTLWAMLALDAGARSGTPIPPALLTALLDGLGVLQEDPARDAKDDRDGVEAGFKPSPTEAADLPSTIRGLALSAILRRHGAALFNAAQIARLEKIEREATAYLHKHFRWSNLESQGEERFESLLDLTRLAECGVVELDGWRISERVTSWLAGSYDSAEGRVGSYDSSTNTGAALLALAATFGPKLGPVSVATEPTEDEVELIVHGQKHVRLQLGRLGPRAKASWGVASQAIERVEFVARDAARAPERVIATAQGGEFTPERLAEIAVEPSFERCCQVSLRARVVFADPGRAALESAWLRVSVAPTLEPERIALALGRDVIDVAEHGPRYEASSSYERSGPEYAFDGQLSSSWWCGAKDKKPTIEVKFSRAVSARGLRVAHANMTEESGGYARASKVQVVVNRSKRFTFELSTDQRATSSLDFGKELLIESIELSVLERTKEAETGFLGFCEIDFVR